MYKYVYERVTTSMSGFGMFDGKEVTFDQDHRKIIDKRSKEGYRYVGIIPVVQRGTGHTQEFDLVFEKEIEE